MEFTSSDAKATLPADYTIAPEDQGTFTFTATLGTVGTQSITATDTGTSSITGTESNIVVQPGAARSLSITGAPSSVGTASAFDLVVTAL